MIVAPEAALARAATDLTVTMAEGTEDTTDTTVWTDMYLRMNGNTAVVWTLTVHNG